MVEITVSRALAELKNIRKRIQKLIASTTFVSTKRTGAAWHDHVHATKANWQAINDLTSRYQQIKFAVIMSNATTKVSINDTEYTVAEAIAMKECLEQRDALVNQLRRQRNDVQNAVANHEHSVQRKLDNLLEVNFKKDRKTDEGDIKAITDAYLKNNKIEVIDPLNIDTCVTELEDEIQNFRNEVDFVLSESNAITKVQIS